MQLTDEAGAFRASAMISSSGTFVLDDIPAGSYELTLDAADGVTGWANLTVPSNPSGGSLAVNIEARSTAGLDPRQWPCDAIFPSTYEGQPTTCTEEYFMVVPRGSAQLSVQVLAYSPNQQSCSVLADWGYAYNHGKSSVRLFLDGLPITRLEMPFCNMGENQIVFEKSLNVSSLARDRDLVVRGLRTKTSDYSPYFYYHQGVPQQMTGGLDGVIDWQPTPRLTITSVTDRVGAGPIKLSEEEPKGAETKDKFLGVPYDNVGTYAGSGVNDHRWRLRINYSPANAQIAAVRVFVVGPGLQEPLAFDQGPAADGKLDLTNVGFPEFQPHVLWHAKYNRLSIVVELDGVAPDRPAATATGELGIGTDHGPWLLTALYDAARIAGSGGRRYSTDRNTNQGGDGWSAESAYAFLESNTDLVFNDISLEHGGYMSPHSGQGHRVGRGIDVRYFGAGGDGNPLNGTALAPDGSPDRDLGTVRGARVLLAESGNAQAQTEIVDWIQQNRARIGQLLTDSRVEKVLIGDATWNWQSLVEGKYPGGSQIHDTAAAGQPWIGRWQPTGLTPWSAHLSHVHIEIARRP